MTRIAVTGATGFAGRSLAARLQREVVDVVALTRSRPTGDSSFSNLSFISDYLDTSLLADLFASVMLSFISLRLLARYHCFCLLLR